MTSSAGLARKQSEAVQLLVFRAIKARALTHAKVIPRERTRAELTLRPSEFVPRI